MAPKSLQEQSNILDPWRTHMLQFMMDIKI